MKDFVEFLKLPPNILGALMLASGAVLLLPDSMIEKLYMTDFREKHGFLIGIVFLVSTAILIILSLSKLYRQINEKKLAAKLVKDQIKYLRKMDDEKVMLIKAFMEEPMRTLKLPMHDGLVIELQHCNVITPAGSSHLVDMIDPHINYFLQPWVVARIEDDEELKYKFGL